MREYLVKVAGIKYLTLQILELQVRLSAPTDIIFQAGQFVQFKIGTNLRAYSLAAPPIGADEFLFFCIKLQEHGVGSDFARNLKIGDEFQVRGPLGVFRVKNLERDVVFVAVGVGIAPFASMIPDLLAHGYQGQAALLFGVRNEDEVFYYDKFQNLAHQHPNFKFIPTLSQPQSHWPGQMGYVTTLLDIDYDSYRGRQFYVCGSQPFINDVKRLLLNKGHNEKDINYEVFT